MSEYEPQPVNDHSRAASSVILSGAWTGAIAGVAGLGWLDLHIPHLLGFLLNWAAVLAVCYAMAAWKRAWYAWLAFWGMAGACVLCGILQLSGAMRGPASAAPWYVACLMVTIWYWLVRIPRKHPAVLAALERHEIHVFHHVIHHGVQLPGAPGPAISGETTAAVPGQGRKVIAGTAVGAIEPARKVRDALADPIVSTVSRIRNAITEGK